MAICKPIRQDDGVVTNYHRILFVMKTVNRQNSISVLSYVDEAVRSDEIEQVIAQPYCKNVTYELPYDPDMTIEDAYAYLKTMPIFEGAEDV